jgi:hypothetical protein
VASLQPRFILIYLQGRFLQIYRLTMHRLSQRYS